MGSLTTHVLDTSRGRPAAGMRIDLYAVDPERRLIRTVQTNGEGRVGEPLLEDEAMRVGVYELIFHAGEWFREDGVLLADPPFIDQVVLRFGIAEADSHYHVPLLVTPWSYASYRGS